MHISHPLIMARNEGYEISINNKVLTTPQHNILIIPTAELAEAIAEEWKIYLLENTIRRQNVHTIGVSVRYFNYLKGETLLGYQDLPPLMRLASLAIDTMKDQRFETIEKILNILKRDHIKNIYYENSTSLKHNHYCTQLFQWFKEDYGIDFFKENFQKSDIEMISQFLETRNCWALTILQHLSQITNSCILGIALSHRKIDPSVAFGLATIPDNNTRQKNSSAPYQRLILRSSIIAADRFLELSCCWERNNEPIILHRLFSGRTGYKEKSSSTYN